METEIKKIDAILEKQEADVWILKIQFQNPLIIKISDENQEYLKEVFNTLILEMINHPFHINFVAANDTEAKGLNEVCSKYIEILNNDLNGVYESYKKELEYVKTEHSEK